ncbi:CRE-TAG-140 protein [Caenorhabditis remanei]|uniref:CRE-TAG-140 protein n=1 Tax=Caenorhabditis remanei TaxID=31234 RepID=E3MQB7_CAERE|nr:CRE-TAG-140 protein [Caenorhabditis remanei]
MIIDLSDLDKPVNASQLIHQVLHDAFLAADLGNYTEAVSLLDKPPAWQTWGIGFAIISGCSFSAPLGILLLPFLSKSLYERIMTFLVAVGIGALSGSTIFIMLPQAFHLTSFEHFEYHTKSLIILCALYAFFTVDRMLQYILEFRRRRQTKRRIHASTIASLMNTPTAKRRDNGHNVTEETIAPSDPPTITHLTVPDLHNHHRFRRESELSDVERTEQQEKEMAELANDLEMALTNNVLARTFSTRRRVAVVSGGLDDIEFRNPRHPHHSNGHTSQFLDVVNNEFHRRMTPLSSRPGSPVAINIDDHKESYEMKPKHSTQEDNDAMSVSIRVVEKKVIEPAAMEVASVAYMIIFGSSANNFVDGMSMGAAFSDNLLRGLSIGIAVISQQFPQELGVLAILIKSGLGIKKTLLFNMVPIVLSYLGFSVGVMLDSVDDSYDEYIFAISSGMYMYIFLGTLIPEIRESTNELIKENLAESVLVSILQACGILFGTTFMYFMSRVNSVDF